MATLDVLGGDLSELVRDSRLDVVFEPGCTIHPRAAATRREKYSHEKWIPRQDPVGRGGMGLVYVEERESTGPGPGSLRAVKKIQLSGHPGQKKMIRRELEAMFKFSQPRFKGLFIQPYGWFVSEQYVHIAMEFYELGDLQKYLDNPAKCPARRLPEHEAGSIASQILDALYVMHKHNFSHWDLKPANLLIRQQPPDPWRIKLGDFGISKRGDAMSNFTSLAGTLEYMPPEHHGYRVREGADNSRAVDIWCLGTTIYRLMTGQGMFRNGQERHSFFSSTSPFPDSVLRKLQIGEDGISFLRKLVVVDPDARIDVEVASRDPWIERHDQQSHGSQENVSVPKESRQNSEQSVRVSLGRTMNEYSATWSTDEHAYPGRPSSFPVRTGSSQSQPYPTSTQSTGASAAWPTTTRPVSIQSKLYPASAQTTRASAAWPTTTRPVSSQSQAYPASAETPQATAAWATVTPIDPSPAPDFLDFAVDTARKDDAELFFSDVSSPGVNRTSGSAPDSHPQITTQGWSADLPIGPPRPGNEITVPIVSEYPSHMGTLVDAVHKDLGNGGYDEPKCRVERNLEIEELAKTLGKDHMTVIDAKCALAKEAIEEEDSLFEAQRIYQHALLVKKKVFGNDDPRTLQSMHDLGDALLRSYKFEEAHPICREAFQKRMRVLGNSNIDTVESLGNLGGTLLGQERYREAEKIFRDVLEKRTRLLGATDERTVDTMVSLAICLGRDNRSDAAEPILQEALSIIRKAPASYEKRAPDTIHILCIILNDLGRLDEAEALLRDGADQRNPDYFLTSENMYWLCLALDSLGHEEEAEPKWQRLIKERNFTFGKENVTSMSTVQRYIQHLSVLGEWEKALAQIRDLVELREEVLTAGHVDTIYSMRWLGRILLKVKGPGEESLLVLRRALRLAIETWGEYDNETLDASFEIGDVLVNSGAITEGREILQTLLAKQQKTLGRTHPAAMATMNSLITSFLNEGDEATAERWLRSIVQLNENEFGADFPGTISATYDLADFLQRIRRFQEAEDLYRKVLAYSERTLGQDYPDTLQTMAALGKTLHSTNQYGEAEHIFRTCIHIYEGKAGHDIAKAELQHSLAETLSGRLRYPEAEEHYRQAWLLRRDAMGEMDEVTIAYMIKYAAHLVTVQKPSEAEPLLQEAAQLCKTLRGEQDPETLHVMEIYARTLEANHDVRGAIEVMREIKRHQEATKGVDSPECQQTWTYLGVLYQLNSDWINAEITFIELYEMQKARLGYYDEQTLQSLHTLAEIRMHLGRYIEAMGMAGKACKLRSQYLTDDSWRESERLQEECRKRLLN